MRSKVSAQIELRTLLENKGLKSVTIMGIIGAFRSSLKGNLEMIEYVKSLNLPDSDNIDCSVSSQIVNECEIIHDSLPKGQQSLVDISEESKYYLTNNFT